MKLLIVESPAKAKTIEKYLGKDFKVVASVGHVRDLKVAEGSVDVENNFAMTWEIMKDKEKQIKLIESELKKADTLYLASDQDREGEAIAWHLYDILNSRGDLKGKKVERITFNEITKKAITEAIEHPREIDQNLVDAYLARRALDYLVGFNLSPVLWRKLPGAKSAGRVQSVALWLVVDREREIEQFKPIEYWSMDANCITGKKESFVAKLTRFRGEKIEKETLKNQADIDRVMATLSNGMDATIISVEKKKTQRRPVAPFTTSTLQQEASRKLRFAAKRTMSAAQHLYERGFITYMRTDAVNLSNEAIAAIREYVNGQYGKNYLPDSPIMYANKSKNAQEAHEAIRPTEMGRSTVMGLVDSSDAEKLYELIWKRTIACQMAAAQFDSVVVDVAPKNELQTLFHAVGTTQVFDGFLKVYQEDQDDKEDEENKKLPMLNEGDDVSLESFLPEQHFTQAPPRYTEASLVKKLEELGIGRPSTYANILSVIVDRNYVDLNKQRFIPTERGWVVALFLAQYFPRYVAVDFTAKLEDDLDEIANGKKNWIKEVRAFWDPFIDTVKSVQKITTTDVIDMLNSVLSDHLFKRDENGELLNKCPDCADGKLALKIGKFGGFIGCSNYPTCTHTRQLIDNKDDRTDEQKAAANNGAAVLGEDAGEPVTFRTGRFGPYVQKGDGPTAERASAKGENSETMTLEKALALIAGQKKPAAEELGTSPETKAVVLYYSSGKFGPYVSSAGVNASVRGGKPTLDEAVELLSAAKKRKFTKR